ncbi:MAG: magnesium transporter MgtE N-terminal domain-containing protein, partial [Panacagrimonas sp.]
MSPELSAVVDKLNRRYLREHPGSAARHLETMVRNEALDEIAGQPTAVLVGVWPSLGADHGAALLSNMGPTLARDLLAGLLPTEAVRFLGAMEDEERNRVLETLDPDLRTQLRELMSYPDDTAGRLMDTRVPTFRPEMRVSEALSALRDSPRSRAPRTLFVVDGENHLRGQIPIQELAMAQPDTALRDLAHPVTAAVNPMD